MASIEIESCMMWPDKAIGCSPDCELCYIADWDEDGSPKRFDCVKEWMVDNKPGRLCPGPGEYRLVSEKKIAELRMNFLLDFDDGRKREFETNTNTVKILFDQAGLGKEPK